MLTAVLALTLSVISAYAAFTTNYVNGPLTFQSGAIGLSGSNSSFEQSWYADNLTPGDTISYNVTLSNTGNIPLTISSATASVTGNLAAVLTTGITPPTGGWSALQPGQSQTAKVWVTMSSTADNNYISQSGNVQATFNASSVNH